MRFLKSIMCFVAVAASMLGNAVSITTAAAPEQFDTDLHTSVRVSQHGATLVSSRFTITNLTSTAYLSSYQITLGSERLSNIRVQDVSENAPSISTTTADRSTTIQLTFPDKLVGKDRQRSFVIEYTDPDIARVTESTAEIVIPPIQNPDQFAHYSVSLELPPEFGEPQFVSSPSQSTSRAADQHQEYLFTDSVASGLSAFFGTVQHHQFQLSYAMANPTGNRGVVQVVLIPDTQYQTVHYSKLDPEPQSLDTDQDGNWIATYTLDSQQEQSITASGIVSISIHPRHDFAGVTVEKDHTKAREFWETHDDSVKQFARTHTTPSEILSAIAAHLTHDYSPTPAQRKRRGAADLLGTPTTAHARDYSDLFVTVARASGIPARQIVGFASSPSSARQPLSQALHPYHFWAEYHNGEHWQAVDPTWADTQGSIRYTDPVGFHHITFAQLGTSSTDPLPTLSADRPGVKDFSFQSQPTTTTLTNPIEVSTTLSPTNSSLLLIGSQYLLTVTNHSGTAAYQIPITVESSSSINAQLKESTIRQILPHQSITIPLRVYSTTSHQNHGTLTLTIANQTFHYDVQSRSLSEKISALSDQSLIVLGGMLITTAILLVIAVVFVARKIAVPKNKR